ncbi:hypothetical protein [Nonomuraea sp. NPDC049141]|uniref:hypothetical protein n=1 Tax=Nonomuraea sp. NPDC049141 TaxID=3155500 RepID=UPI0033CC4C5C
MITVVHPVITSHDALRTTNEARTNWVVDDDYFHTGARQRNWMGNTVTWYHRTIEDYVTALTQAGFASPRYTNAPLATIALTATRPNSHVASAAPCSSS